MTTKKTLLALVIVLVSLTLAFFIQAKEKKELKSSVSELTPPPSAQVTPPASTPPPTSPSPTPKIIPQHPETPTQTGPKAPPSTTTTPLKVITVESGNLYYKPSVIHLSVDQPVKFVIKNKGEHTFTVNELGIDLALDGDRTSSVTTTPKKKGTFAIYCAVAGHKEAGMVGKIIVE